jgi:flavin reductase (DIM6/NTAB) family NADH-FMN oxidoreductase RutF
MSPKTTASDRATLTADTFRIALGHFLTGVTIVTTTGRWG